MELPSVSIVVPVYNSAEYLENCIESLLALNYPKHKLEIIAVDNLSTDASYEILQKFESSLRILQERTRGAGAARNLGVLNSQHSIIAFTDSDCKVDKNWLLQLVLPLQNQQELIATGGRNLSQEPVDDIALFGNFIHDQCKAIHERIPYIITMNMAIRKNTIMEIGLFDTAMIWAEDTDLSFRLFQNSRNFSYVDEAVVYHKNPNSLIALYRKGYQHGHWNVKLIKKHQNLVLAERGRLKKYGNIRLGKLLNNFVRTSWVHRQLAIRDFYQLIYDLGKKTGMLLGSIRFRFLYI